MADDVLKAGVPPQCSTVCSFKIAKSRDAPQRIDPHWRMCPAVDLPSPSAFRLDTVEPDGGVVMCMLGTRLLFKERSPLGREGAMGRQVIEK